MLNDRLLVQNIPPSVVYLVRHLSPAHFSISCAAPRKLHSRYLPWAVRTPCNKPRALHKNHVAKSSSPITKSSSHEARGGTATLSSCPPHSLAPICVYAPRQTSHVVLSIPGSRPHPSPAQPQHTSKHLHVSTKHTQV